MEMDLSGVWCCDDGLTYQFRQHQDGSVFICGSDTTCTHVGVGKVIDQCLPSVNLS